MPYRIVVGVDGSPHGAAALAWALAEAQARDGEVTAVYAWQMPLVSMPGAFDRAEMERASRDYLSGLVREAAPPATVRLSLLVAEGDPAECLIAAARGASLLVVGTRGRSPWTGLLLGSVSQRCAAGAACPVVFVKLPTDTVPASVPSPPA